MGTSTSSTEIEGAIIRDFFSDGMVDLLLGTDLLLVGMLLRAGIGGAAVPFLLFPILFFAPLLGRLKTGSVLARTGYVKPRPGCAQPQEWALLVSLALGLVGMGGVLLVATASAQAAQQHRWPPILFGIWLTGTFVGFGIRMGLGRYYLAAAAALMGGIGVPLLVAGAIWATMGIFLVVLGGTIAGVGLFAFVRFLASTPQQAPPAPAAAKMTSGDLAAITGLDRLVHQPARLRILATLRVKESAGFIHVMHETGLTRGNLSSHVSKLESSGYLEVKKEFVDRTPRTLLSLTPRGHAAYQSYVERMKQVLEGLPS
jgi:DNA-binding MarR family transcriptional regulator